VKGATVTDHIFDPKKLDKLNNPDRHLDFPLEQIADRYALSSPKTIIDLGAGTGLFSLRAAEIFPRAVVHALDISDIMISWIKKHRLPRFSQIHPQTISGITLPFEDNTADLLFMVNLHHELPDPQKTLQECFRVLTPGSTLLISDWHPDAGPGGPPKNIRFFPEEVAVQCREAGFETVNSDRNFPHNYLVTAVKPA
jgi:ubiquinone/menaquinone biosynthesis C-methylase UbiE